MNSICFFCSYYTSNDMPAYVKFYLKEISRHFSEVVLVTNEKEITSRDVAFLTENKIFPRPVVNDGYDFGMWYKMLGEYDVLKYDRVGLINDSCILFKSLDFVFKWLDETNADYCGLTDSYDISYHLQSYFLIINKRAIPVVLEYFRNNGIVNDFLELIKVYEVGLSTAILEAGLTVKAYYQIRKDKGENPMWLDIKNLIKKGFPLIKKKIIRREYRFANLNTLIVGGFDPYPSHYLKLIKKMTGTSFPGYIFSEIMSREGFFSERIFDIRYAVFSIYGFLRPALSTIKGLVIKKKID